MRSNRSQPKFPPEFAHEKSNPSIFVYVIVCGSPPELHSLPVRPGQNQGTIVFIPKSTSATFYLFLVKGAKDRAKELGYTIDYQGPATETEIASQVDLVRNISRSKPAGILLAALDSKGLIPPVEEALQNGVPVVMVDSGIDSDLPKASVTTDNYDGGFKAGLRWRNC